MADAERMTTAAADDDARRATLPFNAKPLICGDSLRTVDSFPPLDDQIDRGLNTERMLSALSTSLGTLALLLSLAGLYRSASIRIGDGVPSADPCPKNRAPLLMAPDPALYEWGVIGPEHVVGPLKNPSQQHPSQQQQNMTSAAL